MITLVDNSKCAIVVLADNIVQYAMEAVNDMSRIM